jgi:uncharacterized protein YndB with AHSA1/START domain
MKSTVVRVERQAAIARPITDVFDRLADIGGYSGWMPRTGLFGSCRATGNGDATSYWDSSRIGPWRGNIVVFERPTRIAFRQTLRWFGKDVMEARPTYLLESEHGTTTVRHVAEGELFGMFRVMKPVTALLAKRERRLILEALKSSLESTDGSAPLSAE